MNEQIAALLILLILALFVGYVISRLQNEQLKEVMLGNSVVMIAGALFCLLLVVQLLKEQAWMPDLLKVVAGVVAGAIAAKKADEKSAPEQKLQQIAVGKQIQQAARDINNIQSELSKIEKSIVNQNISQAQKHQSVVAYGETEMIDLNYRDNPEVTREYERIAKEFPDDFKYKPIRGEDGRAWYDRKVRFFSMIPGAGDRLAERIQDIRAAGWEVKEVRFDFSSVNVVIIISTEKRIPLDDRVAA
ncbi:hypothetical protein [Bradyrhizobium cenepequi]